MPSKIEQTLAIIKPDAFPEAETIINIIEVEGFAVVKKKEYTLSQNEAEEFYAEHKGKDFMLDLIRYMTSGPCLVMVLAKDNAIRDWRRLLGPTKVQDAIQKQPNSIRAQFGRGGTQNAAHGSDSPKSAQREIEFFYPDMAPSRVMSASEATDYLNKEVNPTLLKGLTELCKQKPEEPLVWLADWLLVNNPKKQSDY